MAKILMIIAQKGYQDLEYGEPRRIFEKAGYTVVTASKQKGECMGALGGRTEAELALNDVRAEDYVAVIFVGGPGAVMYLNDKEAWRIAKETVAKGKILGAICIAPLILAHAKILGGKKATVWNGDGQQADVLVAYGAEFIDKNVVVDGKIVTANGPSAAKEFGREIIRVME